jgi:DNA-binding SARP family transcriptional activator
MRGPVVAAKLRVPRSDALARDRLDALLGGLWSRRLALVVAPAGSGKTTLLARLAATSRAPVAWYRADNLDGSLSSFLSHLEAALLSALGDLPGGWTSVVDMAHALDTWTGERALLVIDDFHALEGTPGEQALERMIEYAPSWLVLAVGSRSRPALNLSRLRVSGGLLEVGVDDLRFRSWEVERLFRDFYRDPLPPVELATLAHKTEGWAAGLQLFHLATRSKPAEERRRILAALDRRSGFLHEYLTWNVLDQLPVEQREFLVRTCVLGRLSGPICDRFTAGTGSDALLGELERRQVFVQPLEEEGTYRYHEVLRSHLEVVLLHDVGEPGVRDLHGQSARVLEEFGALPEALHSYCRAENWAAVDRLLGRNGEQIAEGSARWVDSLPAYLLDHDPWLLLARARRHRAEGRWEAAVSAFQQAERGFGSSEAAATCHRERQAIGAWLNLNPPPPGDPLGVLRLLVQRDPLGFRDTRIPGAGVGTLIAGAASLAAGDVREAARSFELCVAAADAAGAVQVGARLGLIAARVLSGDAENAADAATTGDAAEQLGHGFLARLAKVCAALPPGGEIGAEAAGVRLASEQVGDHWGAALVDLAEGWAGLQDGGAQPGAAAAALSRAVAWFHRMGAEVLEAWACGLLALAAVDRSDGQAMRLALDAERLANARGVEGAKLFAYLALAQVDRARSREYAALAGAVQAATGLAPPGRPSPEPARITVRLFGGFELAMDGVVLDLQDVKPRARTLLRLLCVHAGRPVHRGAIQIALWPDADADAGTRNLNVAMSSIRLALRRSGAAGHDAQPTLLVREGDAYRLALGPESHVDLLDFEERVTSGRRAREVGDDPGAAVAGFRAALDLYRGELLPEDGVEEWVLDHRERARSLATEAARGLAELLLEQGRADAAVQACLEGLHADRFHDPLWQLLVLGHEQAGDRMAASRARHEYHSVLAEMGLAGVQPAR